MIQFYNIIISIISNSILRDNSKQNDDKTHGKSVGFNSNINVNTDEHWNKSIKEVQYKLVETQIEYKVFFAQVYLHYSNNFDSQIQYYFGNYNNNYNNNSYSFQSYNNNNNNNRNQVMQDKFVNLVYLFDQY